MYHIRHSGKNHHNPLQDELQQVFERFFGDSETDSSSVVTSQWVPRVDIKEEPNRFVIFADLPGVDPASIEVNMDKGVLSIKGERKTEAQAEGERWSRSERAHGVFFRRFALCGRQWRIKFYFYKRIRRRGANDGVAFKNFAFRFNRYRSFRLINFRNERVCLDIFRADSLCKFFREARISARHFVVHFIFRT